MGAGQRGQRLAPIAFSGVALVVSMQTRWQQNARRRAKLKVSFRPASHEELSEDYASRVESSRVASSPDIDEYRHPDLEHASLTGLRIVNVGKGEAKSVRILSTGIADEGKWFTQVSQDLVLPNDWITPVLLGREFDGAKRSLGSMDR
jgi:hypothetical protein